MARGTKRARGAAHQKNGKQREGVDHSCDRSESAGADVGGGTSDGARGRNAAEERRANVGDSLRDQLHVGVVVIAAHAVGDHGGEQAFNGGEQRDREGGREQGQNVGRVESGE